MSSSASLLDEARDALRFFRKEQDVEEEFSTMNVEAQGTERTAAASTWDCLNYPRPLMVGWGIVCLQQITGQPTVLYFTTTIFMSAGLGTSSAALSSVGVAAVKVLATIFAVTRVDDFGRRTLLFIGISIMIVAYATMAVAFLFQECSDASVALSECTDFVLPQGWAFVTIFALMLCVSGYQVGFGPVAWCLVSEVFPQRVRGPAVSTAAISNFAWNFLVTSAEPTLERALLPSGMFAAFMLLSVVALLFVKYIVPETKGKTLEEIEAVMTRSDQEFKVVSARKEV